MEVKFDIHTHVGHFPSSAKSLSNPFIKTPEETAQFLLDNKITHHMCLYPRDEYSALEELAALAPDVKHYGVQVVMGKDPEHADYIENLVLDYGDPDKPLCAGVKIATHRGFWKRKKKEYIPASMLTPGKSKFYELKETEVIESGLDYGKYSRQIKKYILNKLGANAIVSMHLQGDPVANMGSGPLDQAKFAYKYPWLKFVGNHIGDYGPPSQAAKHSKLQYVKKTGDDVNGFPAFRYSHSYAVISSWLKFAEELPNMYGDTSCFLKHKAELCRDHPRWAIGSDWPVMEMSYTAQEKQFVKVLGQEAIDLMNQRTVEWFERDWKDLYKDHVAEKELKDDIDTVISLIESKL